MTALRTVRIAPVPTAASAAATSTLQELRSELTSIAVQQSARDRAVVRFLREHTGQDCTSDPAESVAEEDIERVIKVGHNGL